MEENSIKKEGDQPIVEKKVYTPPTLIVYGKLTELTAGGSHAHGEPANPNDPDYKNKQRP